MLANSGFTSHADADGLWLDKDRRVAVAPTDVGFFVGWLDVAWPGPGTPVPQVRDVIHIPADVSSDLQAIVEETRQRSQASMRACRYCSEWFPPGYMHAPDVCQGCAEQHLGVVH